MKHIFTTTFFCLAVATFAQDTKKDTTAINYGTRTFDARLGRYMNVDPKQNNNPYQFADTAKVKMVANKVK